jgi:hypothetical protein
MRTIHLVTAVFAGDDGVVDELLSKSCRKNKTLSELLR